MKLRSVIWGIFSLSILLTACGSTLQGNNRIVIKESELEEKSDMKTKVDMTAEQEVLLRKISVNEDRVEDGNLLSWQVEVLRQYDYAMEYLAAKYPSYTFHIVDCEPKNKLNNAYSKFTFQEGNNGEKYYDLYLYVEDSKYSAEDNFYGRIIGSNYVNKLKALLLEQDIPCDKVETLLNTVQGEAFNENMAIDDIMSGAIEMQQMTTIYVDSNSLSEDSYEDTFKKIKQFITEKKIYGSYSVIISEYASHDTNIFEKDFNVFN